MEFINRRTRCEAVYNGDRKKNEKLAADSVASRKKSFKGRKKKVDQQKCESSTCIITVNDVNVEWVQCD